MELDVDEDDYSKVPLLRNFIFQNGLFHFLCKDIFQKIKLHVSIYSKRSNMMESCYENAVLGI